MRRAALALGACAALAPPLRAFELECFHGAGSTQPAGSSTGSRAMTFPNELWTEEWLEAYQEAHPELHVLDEFGFFTGYALSFDIDAGQPPDEATFAALVVSGTNIPPSDVSIISYRQTLTWRMRLPGVVEDYANVAGEKSVSCTETVDRRAICDSTPCNCDNRVAGVGITPRETGYWDCSGEPACAAHSVVRWLATPLHQVDSFNTQEDIDSHNDFLRRAVTSLTVAPSPEAIRIPGRFTCEEDENGDCSARAAAGIPTRDCRPGPLRDCAEAVEANLTLTFDGDKYNALLDEYFGGDAGTMFGGVPGNMISSLNYSFVMTDPRASMAAETVHIYLDQPNPLDKRRTLQVLPWIEAMPTISTTVEYTVDNLKPCNATVAAEQRFQRYDGDGDGLHDSDELALMLYEMGREQSPGLPLSAEAVDDTKPVLDTDEDGLFSFAELLAADERRVAMQAGTTVHKICESAGWQIMSSLGAVTRLGNGLGAVSSAGADPHPASIPRMDVTREAVGRCIVELPMDNPFAQKACIITEILGLPELVPTTDVRCVRKESIDMFLNPILEYMCVPWELCGDVPDPAYTATTGANYTYNCEFSQCTPDRLQFGDGSVTENIADFRCWDSCRLASGMDECSHIEQRTDYCRYGDPCFFVDTLDDTVKTEEDARAKLDNASGTINEYAAGCSAAYVGVGYVEECRWMRCHGMGMALGSACGNAVPPPCRSVCQGYVDSTASGVLNLSVHNPLGACGDDDPIPAPDAKTYWTWTHCRALRAGNCTAFPPDTEHATGGCQLPDRYAGGTPCVRDAECLSQACPHNHSDDSPPVPGEGGVCCNPGLNGCSGHGVCTMHANSTTPQSMQDPLPVPFGGCVCDKEWTGPDCSQWMMPLRTMLIIMGVVAFMVCGSLSWCAVWLRWFIAAHSEDPPEPPPIPIVPKKPRREESTSESDSEDEDAMKLSCYICRCTGLPSRKGKLDTYVATVLTQPSSKDKSAARREKMTKRTPTCVNGGLAPRWDFPWQGDGKGAEIRYLVAKPFPGEKYSLLVEVKSDEARYNEGQAHGDLVICRTTLDVGGTLNAKQREGCDYDLYDADSQPAGSVRIRFQWTDPAKDPERVDKRVAAGGGNGGGSWVEAKPHQSFRQKPQPPASGRPAPRKALPDTLLGVQAGISR